MMNAHTRRPVMDCFQPLALIATTFAATVIALSLGQMDPGADGSVIDTYGDGNVSLAPDSARITVGVSSREETALGAMNATNERISHITAGMRENGVLGHDIQTSNLALTPTVEYREGGIPNVIGYTARNTVTVLLKDLERVSVLLDDAVAAGANEVHGISLELQENTAALDRARELAILDAHGKAKVFADASGMRLGRILSISDNDGGMVSRPMGMSLKSSGSPLEAGEIPLTSSVSVRYQLLPAR